ncbi:hypothetical protein JTB14_032180 [Gonioctena quinquepunctata]|nr:hypothetical protein JTB14_032180 [Gonioctena quinquepunctata]
MSNPLDENFFYNSMLAKALLQLLPPNEQKMMRIWFNKLLEMSRNNTEKNIRNEYMWFILLMLQCQKIRDPFNAMPPTEIGPLRDIVSPKVYEEVLVANDDNMPIFGDEKKVQFKHSAPAQFFHNQPVPKDGVICYMSAFSDRGL